MASTKIFQITTETVFLYEFYISKKKTLKKSDGAVKNEQSRETCNIGYTRQLLDIK